MSSHRLDMSGQRQLALTINDPAATVAWAPAKQGDDVDLTFGGREVRIALGPTARIQRRLVPVKKQRVENGHLVKVDGEYVYDDAIEERLVLVVPSLTGFVRSSLTPDERAIPDGTEGKPTYEAHTHTTVTVRRRPDDYWHPLEAGTIDAEHEVGDLLAQAAQRPQDGLSPDVG